VRNSTVVRDFQYALTKDKTSISPPPITRQIRSHLTNRRIYRFPINGDWISPPSRIITVRGCGGESDRVDNQPRIRYGIRADSPAESRAFSTIFCHASACRYNWGYSRISSMDRRPILEGNAVPNQFGFAVRVCVAIAIALPALVTPEIYGAEPWLYDDPKEGPARE
jgi:hypothetical protein